LNNKNKRSNEGFTLVEALIAMAIIGFVIVTILGGFSHQQMATRILRDKNAAIRLADVKMQEMCKYNSEQLGLAEGITTEYIIPKEKTYEIYVGEDNNPDDPMQFRRTTRVQRTDILGRMVSIQVLVEYGKARGAESYPFRIVLSTTRGV
jgi:type II secretion system protein I